MTPDSSPLYDLVDSRRQALGLSWPDVVQRCGYANVPKGLRRLEAIWAGNLRARGSATILRGLAVALGLDEVVVRAAVEQTQDQLDASAERKARAAFQPSAYLLGTSSRPSQIVIFGMTGGVDRWLRVPLDLTQPPETFVRQAMSAACDRPIIAFFGPTTGFVVNYTFDRSVQYDTEGRQVREFDQPYVPGTVRLRIGGRNAGTGRIIPSKSDGEM